jgi:Glycosyl hydrolase family 3 C-terminal domain
MSWADGPNFKAILVAHFPGQEAGSSIVDVLYGDVNPSGKLPYTIPQTKLIGTYSIQRPVFPSLPTQGFCIKKIDSAQK